MIRLTFAPDLVEETILLAEPGLPAADRRAFRGERDPLYEIRDPQTRDDRFVAFHARWFTRLGLDRAIDSVVSDVLGQAPRVEAGRVLRALGRRDEGADLVDSVASGRDTAAPLLVLRVRPIAVLAPAALRDLLAHELMHVRDMLDPAFGYERSLPVDSGPLTETTLRDRYRVLWDTTIDGRLSRAGCIAAGVVGARRHEFEAAFPMLGGRAARAFDAWFDQDRPTHGELVAYARSPESVRIEVPHADTCDLR